MLSFNNISGMNIKAHLEPPLDKSECESLKDTNEQDNEQDAISTKEKDAMCIFVLNHKTIISDDCNGALPECSVELKGTDIRLIIYSICR